MTVDGGSAVRISGDTAIAVTKLTSTRIGATLNRRGDKHSEFIRDAMADGWTEYKLTGDEIKSFRKLKNSTGGREDSKNGEVDRALIRKSVVDERCDEREIAAGTFEDSRAISNGDRPPYGNWLGEYLVCGISSTVELTSQSKP